MAERSVVARLSTQTEQKEGKGSALRNARVDPRRRDRATKTDLGQNATQEIGK